MIEHENYLEQKRYQLEKLKSMAISLRSFVLSGSISERKIHYLLSRIEEKLPKRILLLERRIMAFRMFISMYELRNKVSILIQAFCYG